MYDIIFKKNHSKEYKEIIENAYYKIGKEEIDFSQFTYDMVNCEFDLYYDKFEHIVRENGLREIEIHKEIEKGAYTLLHRACDTRNLEIIESLLENGADLNHRYVDINRNFSTKSCKQQLLEIIPYQLDYNYKTQLYRTEEEIKHIQEKITYLINKFENRPNKLCRII
jgi:hypothetical protein